MVLALDVAVVVVVVEVLPGSAAGTVVGPVTDVLELVVSVVSGETLVVVVTGAMPLVAGRLVTDGVRTSR